MLVRANPGDSVCGVVCICDFAVNCVTSCVFVIYIIAMRCSVCAKVGIFKITFFLKSCV